jgi:hypothetical protein
MYSGRHPANMNEPPPSFSPWAAWPGVRPYVAAWGALACAGIGAWLAMHEAALEAGGALIRRQQDALGALPGSGETVDAIAAAVEDVRDCGAAVMQAQVDALDALRKSA